MSIIQDIPCSFLRIKSKNEIYCDVPKPLYQRNLLFISLVGCGACQSAHEKLVKNLIRNQTNIILYRIIVNSGSTEKYDKACSQLFAKHDMKLFPQLYEIDPVSGKLSENRLNPLENVDTVLDMISQIKLHM